MKKVKSFPALALSLLIYTQVHAATLVYEGFGYTGSIANGATMNGVATTGTGLTGNFAVANVNGGSSTYNTTGLTFSGNFFATTGGALRMSGTSTANTSSTSNIGLAWNAGTVTGTVYSSFLFVPAAESPLTGALAAERINTTIGGAGGYFISQADGGGGVGAPAVGYDATTTTTASTLTTATTYLAISRFTNVGSALSVGTPGTANLWILTSTGYDAWVAAGALEASLSTFATVSVTDTATTGTFNLSNAQFAQFNLSTANDGTAGRTQTYTFDELRYGTTLADVAIPEPATGVLALGGILLLALKRTRRN